MVEGLTIMLGVFINLLYTHTMPNNHYCSTYMMAYPHLMAKLLQKRILWVTCGKIRGYPIGGSVTVNFGQLLLDLSFVLIIV